MLVYGAKGQIDRTIAKCRSLGAARRLTYHLSVLIATMLDSII
jgi:hypothetical protein